jgi:hypothetical protein
LPLLACRDAEAARVAIAEDCADGTLEVEVGSEEVGWVTRRRERGDVKLLGDLMLVAKSQLKLTKSLLELVDVSNN